MACHCIKNAFHLEPGLAMLFLGSYFKILQNTAFPENERSRLCISSFKHLNIQAVSAISLDAKNKLMKKKDSQGSNENGASIIGS